MIIKMKSKETYSLNGVNVTLEKDSVHEVDDKLGNEFISNGHAELYVLPEKENVTKENLISENKVVTPKANKERKNSGGKL